MKPFSKVAQYLFRDTKISVSQDSVPWHMPATGGFLVPIYLLRKPRIADATISGFPLRSAFHGPE